MPLASILAAQRHICPLLAEPDERTTTGPVDRRELGKERKWSEQYS